MTEVSSYKGDSPNKKMVRALAWSYAIDLMKEINQEIKGAYVLAGHGGDIRTLKGVIDVMYPRESDHNRPLYPLTRHPEKWLHRPNVDITAVDYDQSLVDQLHKNMSHISDEKESGIGSIKGYVGDAARLVSKAAPYNLSHMDFCNAISVDNLYTVGEVIRNSTGISYHMVTVMRGREPGPRPNDVLVPNIHRGERRKMKLWLDKKLGSLDQRQLAKLVLSRGQLDVKKAIKDIEESMRDFIKWKDREYGVDDSYLYFKKDGSLTPYATGSARATVFTEILGTMLTGTHAVRTVYHDAYQSNTVSSKGTPFTTFGILSVPTDGCMNFPGITYSHFGGNPVSSYQAALQICLVLAKRVMKLKLSAESMALYHGTKQCLPTLRNNACLTAFHRGANTSADVYCLNKGSVAAWLAHATRGTYGLHLKDIASQYAKFPPGHPNRPKMKFMCYADKTKFEF
tara:strand:+ start:2403 stop:3770 length:1368 start_codon:yes stop_codon:yes gene_type:complete